MNTSPQLFHEHFEDALREVIATLGGFKVVASKMRPEKTPEAAARWLHDCFNEGKQERLSPDHVMYLLREGRRVSAHAGMNYLLRECGYHDAQPLDPEDERAILQRQFVQSVQQLAVLTERIARTDPQSPSLRVAS